MSGPERRLRYLRNQLPRRFALSSRQTEAIGSSTAMSFTFSRATDHLASAVADPMLQRFPFNITFHVHDPRRKQP